MSGLELSDRICIRLGIENMIGISFRTVWQIELVPCTGILLNFHPDRVDVNHDNSESNLSVFSLLLGNQTTCPSYSSIEEQHQNTDKNRAKIRPERAAYLHRYGQGDERYHQHRIYFEITSFQQIQAVTLLFVFSSILLFLCYSFVLYRILSKLSICSYCCWRVVYVNHLHHPWVERVIICDGGKMVNE